MSLLAIIKGESPVLAEPGKGVGGNVTGGDRTFVSVTFWIYIRCWNRDPIVSNTSLLTEESSSSSISPFPKLGTPFPSPNLLASSERDYFSNPSRMLYNSLGSRVSATSGPGTQEAVR